MKCATCHEPRTLSISITSNVHEGACTTCWNAWDEHAAKVTAALPLDMQRPSFALAEYRRWQAWQRATTGRATVPRVACL